MANHLQLGKGGPRRGWHVLSRQPSDPVAPMFVPGFLGPPPFVSAGSSHVPPVDASGDWALPITAAQLGGLNRRVLINLLAGLDSQNLTLAQLSVLVTILY